MSLRLFAAIAVPDRVAERALAVQRGVAGAIWRPRENLHITLRFFGDTAEPIADELDLALQEIAARTPPFALRLKGAGVFGKEEPHTLWLGVDPGRPLALLAAECERAARRAGLKPEPRKYAPHLTLGRLRSVDRAQLIRFEQRLGLFETDQWLVDRVRLYSSQVRRTAPSSYAVEAEYPLGA
jgi:2'-5' RNA ligase